jgi:hypothetical protein
MVEDGPRSATRGNQLRSMANNLRGWTLRVRNHWNSHVSEDLFREWQDASVQFRGQEVKTLGPAMFLNKRYGEPSIHGQTRLFFRISPNSLIQCLGWSCM